MTAAIGQIGTGQGLSSQNPVTTGSVTTNATGSNFEAIVWIAQPTAPTLTIADSKGNVYINIGSQISNTQGMYINRYQVVNGVGGAGHTLTATSTGSPSAMAVALVEMTGCNTTSPLDQSAVGVQGAHTDPVPSGNVTITPPPTGEILISPVLADDSGANITFTEANGFNVAFSFGNVANNPTQGALGTKVVTASGTDSASWSSGQGNLYWATAIDSFLGAPTGSAPIAWIT